MPIFKPDGLPPDVQAAINKLVDARAAYYLVVDVCDHRGRPPQADRPGNERARRRIDRYCRKLAAQASAAGATRAQVAEAESYARARAGRS